MSVCIVYIFAFCNTYKMHRHQSENILLTSHPLTCWLCSHAHRKQIKNLMSKSPIFFCFGCYFMFSCGAVTFRQTGRQWSSAPFRSLPKVLCICMCDHLFISLSPLFVPEGAGSTTLLPLLRSCVVHSTWTVSTVIAFVISSSANPMRTTIWNHVCKWPKAERGVT